MSDAPWDPSTWPERLGIGPGSTVQLMADLTRMAWTARRRGHRFDAGTLLHAFAEAVGTDGLVLVPTFSYHLRSGDAFDVSHTRSNSGALAQAALNDPRFVRTEHPLHSFALAGGRSQAALPACDAVGSFDERSPFGLMHRERGVLVAFDLPLNDALTFVHYVERAVGVRYRRTKELLIDHTDRQGHRSRRRFTTYAKRAGNVNDLAALEPLLARAGALSHGTLEGVRWLRVDLPLAYTVIADDITRNGARSIHHWTFQRWARDVLKSTLRRFGLHTRNDRLADAARTP